MSLEENMEDILNISAEPVVDKPPIKVEKTDAELNLRFCSDVCDDSGDLACDSELPRF